MSEINIKAKLDDTELKAKEAHWTRRIKRLQDEITYTDYSLSKVAYRSVLVVGSITRTMEALGRFLPGVTDPAFNAIYQTITATISSLTSIAAAYIAGGVTAPMAIIVESAAIGLSVYGLAQFFAGQAEAHRELNRMNSEVRNLSVQMQSLRSSLGSLGGMFD